jgi:hypothetical protein
MSNYTNNWLEYLKGRMHLRDPGVDVKIILKGC